MTMGEMFSKLPTEIVYDILLRLPIETISLCRAVNKSWYNTIKHHRFIKTYNTHVIRKSSSPFVIHQDDVLLPSQETDQPEKETSLVFYTQDPPISRIYYCNGWVLSISLPKDPYYYDTSPDRRQPNFICNPITGEHLVIPKSPTNAYSSVTGFGWDPTSRVFKVIRISDDCNYRFYYGTYLEVYNSGKGEWKVTKWTEFEKETYRASWIFRFGFKPNTFLNGSLHWIAYPYSGSMSIVSLKLDTEEFQQVPMPPGLDMDPVESRPKFMFLGIGIPSDRRIFGHYLLVLGECLSLVHSVSDEHVEIWVMNDYGRESSWEKKYIIRSIVMGDTLDLIKGPYKPIKLMQNGEILLLCSDEIMGYYHPVTKAFKPVDNDDVLYHPSASQPSLHVGSLIYIVKQL